MSLLALSVGTLLQLATHTMNNNYRAYPVTAYGTYFKVGLANLTLGRTLVVDAVESPDGEHWWFNSPSFGWLRLSSPSAYLEPFGWSVHFLQEDEDYLPPYYKGMWMSEHNGDWVDFLASLETVEEDYDAYALVGG